MLVRWLEACREAAESWLRLGQVATAHILPTLSPAASLGQTGIHWAPEVALGWAVVQAVEILPGHFSLLPGSHTDSAPQCGHQTHAAKGTIWLPWEIMQPKSTLQASEATAPQESCDQQRQASP